MENISSTADIKKAIQLLEEEQAVKGQLLKEQFYITYESLKPVNLLKNTIDEISSSPYLIDNILGAVTGVASGYLSKKVVVGASGNIFRKLLGAFIQFGVTNLVASHPDEIKFFSQLIFQRIFHKNEAKND